MTATTFAVSRIAIVSLAFSGFASTSAHALPHFSSHRAPVVSSQDSRVAVTLYNSAQSFRDVKVGDKTYTLMPHDSMSLKAPAGTVVYVETTAAMHRKGDVLFTITPQANNTRVRIN